MVLTRPAGSIALAALAMLVPFRVMAATGDEAVFTEAQAERGKAIYPSVCGRCHGFRLDGAPDDPDMLPAPPIAGPKFLRKWGGSSLAALFDYTRAAMPAINPGSLADQEIADVISYMLLVSGMPPGQTELPPDTGSLTRFVIIRAPGAVE